jgi:hypothetical protein
VDLGQARVRKKGKGSAMDLGWEGFWAKMKKRKNGLQQFVFKFDSRIGF